LLDNVTVVPPVGAAPLRFTVQFTEAPPTGLRPPHVSEETPGWAADGAVSPSEKFRTIPLREAVSVALVFADTADALAVKVLLLVPDGTTTDAGRVADALLLDNATVVFVVAAAVRLTVHVAVPGVATLAGVQLRFESEEDCVGWLMVIWPPVPERGRLDPVPSDADRLVIETCDAVLVVVGEM
jgi:hypothetical protein